MLYNCTEKYNYFYFQTPKYLEVNNVNCSWIQPIPNIPTKTFPLRSLKVLLKALNQSRSGAPNLPFPMMKESSSGIKQSAPLQKNVPFQNFIN